MGFRTWLCRCVPGLSTLLLLVLAECALQVLQTAYIGLSYPTFLVHRASPVVVQVIFLCYSVFLHCVSFSFPIRLALSARRVIQDIEKHHTQDAVRTGFSLIRRKEEWTDVVEPGKGNEMEAEPLMAILIPSYKEEIYTLEETLKILASHELARSSYDVSFWTVYHVRSPPDLNPSPEAVQIYLAMEERDPQALNTAEQLMRTFSSAFQDMQYSIHPDGIPGEAPGKSSNISWAAKRVEEKYHNHPRWRNVLVTVMDCDTHLLTQYFQIIRRRHLEKQSAGFSIDMTLYMPPMIFDRNAGDVPCLVRVADLMWCGAGLSCYNRDVSGLDIAIPTAVYTVTLPLVRHVGGWDTGPGAIGEDMHMMLKCYFATGGRLGIECIPSPASHSNINPGISGLRGYIANHRARYAQALRHMWGCLDTGYALSQWAQMGARARGRKSSAYDHGVPVLLIPTPRPRKMSHVDLELQLGHIQLHGPGRPERFTLRNLSLFMRILEAHFLPAHLTIVIVFSGLYSSLQSPIVHCRYLTLILDVTGYARFAGYLIMVAYFAFIYTRYHDVCVRSRVAELQRTGLLYDEVAQASYRSPWRLQTWIDYLLFPLAGIIFGAIPLMQASLSHFWGQHLVYTVSQKPGKKIIISERTRWNGEEGI